MKIPFFGDFYTLDSVNADCQSAINLYPEVVESQTGKNIGHMRGTPGLSLFATLPSSNILALWAGEGRLFAVAGTAPAHLYEVFADGTNNDRGSVGNAVQLLNSTEYQPALIFPNGNQLMVIHGGYVWVDAGSGPAQVYMTEATYTDLVQLNLFGVPVVYSPSFPFGSGDVGAVLTVTGQTGGTGTWAGSATITRVFPNGYAVLSAAIGSDNATGGQATETFGTPLQAGTGAYLDTYGIVAPPFWKNFYISAIDNFQNWSSIDQGTKEGYPDNVLALFANNELLWIFGDLEETEVWQDIGNPNFPFQRLQAGGVIHYGLAAQFSVARLGLGGMAWLAWSAGRGAVQAVYGQGVGIERISTHAIEQVWRSYSTVQDCISYSYIEDGHEFWVLHFPAGDATWCYDRTESMRMGKPMWHRRGYYDGAVLHRDLQRSHAYGYLVAHGASVGVGTAHFVGDHSSGKIYVQSLSNYSDNSKARFYQRACPYVPQENKRLFLSEFQVYVDVGNQDITVTFDYSRDWGHTFINSSSITAPAASNPQAPEVTGYNTRLRWRRLGNSWAFVPRITITSSTARVSLTDAFMEGTPGTS